jgi:hypothetical protein
MDASHTKRDETYSLLLVVDAIMLRQCLSDALHLGNEAVTDLASTALLVCKQLQTHRV